MLLDIDNFKKINDKLGHITGDHVLAEIGETLNEWFPEEMVVRFGGEEFCVLVRHLKADDMLEQAEKLRHHIQQQRPASVDVTVSIGLASTEDHPGLHLSEFLNKADQALYYSKEQERNRASIFTSEGPQESPWNYSIQ
jgi:two-component system cell cycle response regulator